MKELKFRAWDKEKKKMVNDFVLAPTSPTWGGFPIEKGDMLYKAIKQCTKLYGTKLKFDIEFEQMMSNIITSDYTLTDWSNYYGLMSYEIMQYTGLLDKNGIEIYEGDILKNCQGSDNEVFWWGNGWHFSNSHAGAIDLFMNYQLDTDEYPEEDYENNFGKITVHEILGNKYENPELLENK